MGPLNTRMAWQRGCKIASVVLGPLLIVFGVCLKWAIFPAVVTSMVESSLKLEESNRETWEAWVAPPITPYMKFTFFNVTNPEAIVEGDKPEVSEVGHFAYREVREKQNINPILDEISFGSYIHYEFDSDASDEDAKDADALVTIINPVLAIINALQMQLKQQLEKSQAGVCHMIPEFALDVNCTTLPDATLQALCAGADEDGDGKATISFKRIWDVVKSEPFEMLSIGETNIPCDPMLLELVAGMVGMVWTYAEDLLLKPLSAKIDCINPDVSACAVLDDYDNIPEDSPCFCDGLTMTDSPNNLIFRGAHSGLLLSVHSILQHIDLSIIDPSLPNDFDLATPVDNLLAEQGLNLIDLKHGKFGFFRGPDGRNDSKTWWKINSGKYQLDLYNTVLEYNGNTKLPENWWYAFGPTPSAQASGVRGVCHDIIGTDGLGYAPPISKDDPVWIFNDQLCRSIWLSYMKEVDIDGVTAYQFSPTKEVFAMTNPNNFCYCPQVEECAKQVEGKDEWDISDCRNKTLRDNMACTDGLLDLQGCQGVPVIMSTPHFLDADPSLHEAIEGVDPIREKHITFLDIEPNTGLPIQAHKRIQVSVPIEHSDYFAPYKNFKSPDNSVIFPVVWVDEGADIDADNLDKLKSMLVTPFLLVDIATGVLIGLGGVLVILAGGLAFFCKGR